MATQPVLQFVVLYTHGRFQNEPKRVIGRHGYPASPGA